MSDAGVISGDLNIASDKAQLIEHIKSRVASGHRQVHVSVSFTLPSSWFSVEGDVLLLGLSAFDSWLGYKIENLAMGDAS